LQNEETRGSGCQHDNEWVWSRDGCSTTEGSDGHLVALGGNHCSGTGCGSTSFCPECEGQTVNDECICPAQCRDDDDVTVAVRCCADAEVSVALQCTEHGHLFDFVEGCSVLTCAQLSDVYSAPGSNKWGGRTTAMARGNPLVCGESDIGTLNVAVRAPQAVGQGVVLTPWRPRPTLLRKRHTNFP
jgi:hypothetical protein